MIKFVSLVSSSSGNSTFVSDGKTNILVDCGLSGKKLEQCLESIDETAKNLDAILVTHEHSDHIKGVGIVARKYKIPIYTTIETFSAMNIGKIDFSQFVKIEPQTVFYIGDIKIHPFSIPHDAANPLGYSFYLDDEKLTIATDIGTMSEKLFDDIKCSNKIILESNHDVEMLKYGEYPPMLKRRILSNVGHMSNDLTAKTAVSLAKSGTKQIMLAHLSSKNNTRDLAKVTTLSALIKAGFSDVLLSVASKECATSFEY